MASEEKIREFIGLLEVYGLLTQQKGAPALLLHPNPRSRLRAESLLVQGYYRVFFDVTDVDFGEAVESFFRSEKAQWYPQPGLLRSFLPSRLLRDLVAESADAAWAELWEGFGRHFCGPGVPRNAYLYEYDPNDARARRVHGPQWNWRGEAAEVQAKQHTLRAMGGMDALLAKRTVNNEGALVAHWRKVFSHYVQREGIREELSIVHALAADARTQRFSPLPDTASNLLVLYAEAEAELTQASTEGARHHVQ